MSKLFRWFNIVGDNTYKFEEEIATHVKGVMYDIGCGNKKEILKSKIRQYIGLEYLPARKVNDRLSETDADVFGDALHSPFKNEVFDSAVALHLFEHLRDPQRAAHEAYRVLKKDGIFALTVPFMARLHTEPFDFFRFTPHGISSILENAGFTVTKILDGGGMWKVLGARLSGYLYSDLMGLGYGPDDMKTKPKIYLLPFIAPLIIIIVAASRLLDKIHCVKKDSLGYCVICVK